MNISYNRNFKFYMQQIATKLEAFIQQHYPALKLLDEPQLTFKPAPLK